MTSINFSTFVGPHGIPVYHQHIPSVESVAISWVIFTGASDDHVVGANADGIYHWFEHVPFRGTKRFPGGYAATKGPFVRYGGMIGAETGLDRTRYWAHVPQDQWRLALDVTTDLWSQPLLEDESIVAEREIIFEEIHQKHATIGGRVSYLFPSLMWGGHPCGHPVLGSEGTLSSMTPEMLRNAHRLGYDRSRAVLFVSGNVSEDELKAHLDTIANTMPDNGLTERRQPHAWGPFPKQQGKNIAVETEFPSSMVQVLFPVKGNRPMYETLLWEFIAELATKGGTASPLSRIVREERRLAYNTGSFSWLLPDGGWWGFSTQTGKEKIDAVVEAVHDVLKDDVFRSKKRFDEVKCGLSYAPKMRAIDPRAFNNSAIESLLELGKVIGDEEAETILDSFTREEVERALSQLIPENAYIITFEGLGK